MTAQRYVQSSEQAAADAAAEHIVNLLEEALSAQERATLAVSGGSTPRLLFQKLVALRFRWDRVHLFWVDERCVPPTDTMSNYKLADDWLIAPARIARAQVHRICGELEPKRAARQYLEEMRAFFDLESGEAPCFDIVQQGMGPDGHTASLFPGEPLVQDRDNIAAAVFVPKLAQWRITLLPRVLLGARHTVMLVAGTGKAEAVKAVFQGEYNPAQYPAQLALREGRSAWFLDQAAARLLE